MVPGFVIARLVTLARLRATIPFRRLPASQPGPCPQPPDRDPQPVRGFPTFTADLRAMAAWLVRCGITTVAMESTGVYWIPPHEILEEAGIQVCLVNSKHVKHVPGSKIRCAGLSVVAVPSRGGAFESLLPSRQPNLRPSLLEPSPRQPGGQRRSPRAAYAQGAHPDESTDSSAYSAI